MFASRPAAARDADPETRGDRLAQGAERAAERTRQQDPAPGLGAGCKWGRRVGHCGTSKVFQRTPRSALCAGTRRGPGQ
jgi:hypothetical protein